MYSGLTPEELLRAGCRVEGSQTTTSEAITLDIRVKIPTVFMAASPYPSSIVVDAIARFVSDALRGDPSTTNLMENARISSMSPVSSTT